MNETILTEEYETIRTQSIDVVISGMMDLNEQRATHIGQLRTFLTNMQTGNASKASLPKKWCTQGSIGYKVRNQVLCCNAFKMKMTVTWVDDYYEVCFLKGHKWTAEFIATMAMMTLLMTDEGDLQDYTEKLIQKATRAAQLMMQAQACLHIPAVTDTVV